jgi:murein DD-endopeptidase
MLVPRRIHGLFPAALALVLLAGCASAPRQREATVGERIAASALAQVGRPYLYGGSTPRGFDCSGLVRYAYLAAGVTVPRTTRDQYRAAHQVKLSRLEPGDLLFFRIDSRKVSHVAIYAGDGRFVHAPQTGRSVQTGELQDAYFRKRLVAAGRLY